MIKRILQITDYLEKNKALIIYGPRQVGKTTLVKDFLTTYNDDYIYKTGDDIPFSNDMGKCDLRLLQKKIPEGVLLVIDEAQKIPNIGRALKLIIDNIANVSLIVTGSASFELMNHTGEALTGRKKTITLYPISFQESISTVGNYDLDEAVKDFLVYGMYPEVILEKLSGKKMEIISEIANSYLLKDILEFDKVKNSIKIIDLLRLLSFQVGNEVSTTELASNLDISKNTVAHYLDLLEKSFVIFRLNGFSRNLRKEVTKMSKYYFFDLGIRNALIANFNPLEARNDTGQIWENFMMIERMKKNSYAGKIVNYYFWRTYNQKEIDLIEEEGGHLNGFEFKWKPSGTRAPKEWSDSYKNSSFKEISFENFREFLNQ